MGTTPHAPPHPPRASFPQVRMIFCAGKGMWTDDGPSSSRSSSRKTRPALPRVRGRAAAGAHAPAGVWGSVGADAHRVLDRPHQLDLLLGALGATAADDLDHIRGDLAARKDRVAGGLDDRGPAGLGVSVLAGDPRGPVDVDLPGPQLLEFRQRRLALLQARPGRLEGEIREAARAGLEQDRKSTRLNSSHVAISYAVFCLK